MSFNVLIKDGEKAVICLEECDDGRAYIASQFYSGVSNKSEGRFDFQDDLVRAGFGIYRADADKYADDYNFDSEYSSLRDAIKFCKKENQAPEQQKCCNTINVQILNTNKETMNNKNILEKYEQDAYFTKENLAQASLINTNVKKATAGIRRVVEMLDLTADKIEYIESLINSSANSYDVEGTKQALDRAQKVLDALQNNEVFKFVLTTGKTKLEADIEKFDAEEFISE